MFDENFTLAPIDPVLAKVYDKIAERIRLYDSGIDLHLAALGRNKEPGHVAHVAAELARYGAAKAELVRLKELL